MTPALVVQFLTLVVIAVATAIAWGQLRLLVKQLKAQHDWNRRVTALQYSFSADPQIREVRSKLDEHLRIHDREPGEISLSEIKELAEVKYPSILTDLQFILGRLESMCVAMHNAIVDEATCKDMLRGIVIKYYRFFTRYIEDVRLKDNNPLIYKWLETYAKEWDAESVRTTSRRSTEDA